MMVVCKDQLDQIKESERLGAKAAAAVEADITSLLAGKSYEHLVALQKQVQAKLGSGEPVDIDYWEGLLKKLLVWKAKANITCISLQANHDPLLLRLNSKLFMKSLFATGLNSCARSRGTKHFSLKRNYWQES